MSKKPRLQVKSLGDAMQQLRAALNDVSNLKTGITVLEEKCRTRGGEREAALRDAKAARAEHDDLKQRLFASEVECARLRGYMQRVAEDDAVADPLVEVEDQNGKRMVSKRHPTPQFDPFNSAIGHDRPSYDAYGNQREKPKHWVTY